MKKLNLNVYDSDEELLHLLEKGDVKGYEMMFRYYFRRLCLYAENFASAQKTAEDLAGEGLLRVWSGNRSFENTTHLTSTLYKAVQHAGINHQTSLRRSLVREADYWISQPNQEQAHLENLVKAEVLDELFNAILALPKQAKTIILETYIEGKSNKEVAEMLGLSLQTVKNQKNRALNLLRKQLGKKALFLLESSSIWYFLNSVR